MKSSNYNTLCKNNSEESNAVFGTCNLLPHNIPVAEKLVRSIKKHKLSFLTSATGTGKSYVTWAVATALGFKRGMVIVPADSIGKQWIRSSAPWVEMISTYTTYQALTRSVETYKDIDFFIIGECHHMGARIWGQAIRKLMAANPRAKFIGLTATPRRWYDGGKDVTKMFASAGAVKGYTQEEAVRMGIVPKVVYIAGLFSKYIEDALSATAKMACVTPDLYGKIKMALSYASVEKMLEKYQGLLPDTKKVVVFAESIKAIPDAIAFMRLYFPELETRPLHSQMDKQSIEETQRWFHSAKSGCIVNVNMYTQGIHAPGTNMVIMLWRTRSATVLKQQIGRVLEAGGGRVAILDLVGNRGNLGVFDSLTGNSDTYAADDIPKDAGGEGVSADAPSEKLPESWYIVDSEMNALEDVLHELERVKAGLLSPAQKETIRKFYFIEGTDVAKRICVSRKAVSTFARKERLHKTPAPWIRQDLEKLAARKKRTFSLRFLKSLTANPSIEECSEVFEWLKKYGNEYFATAK